MSTKAKLIVILKAGDTVVAEVENPLLWQKVLEAINQGPIAAQQLSSSQHALQPTRIQDSDPISRFAKRLGITKDEVIAAMNPRLVSPFLNLDMHSWAAMKKQTPKRGSMAINSTALAGTLLVLWFKEAGIDTEVTQSLTQGVLKTINITDVNPSRGVRNTKWLQSRPGGIIAINPTEIVKAQEIARSFCTKRWKADKQ